MTALKYIAVLLAIAAIPAHAEIYANEWWLTNTVGAAIESEPLRAFSASNWRLNQWGRTQGGAVALPTNAIPVWWISARTNYATVWAMSTGTLVNATNGHVQLALGWSAAILPAGRYISSVRIYQPGATSNEFIGTLAQHWLDVTANPDASAYAMQAPVNISSIVLSNQLGRGFTWNSATTNWETEAAAAAGATNASGSGRLNLTYVPATHSITGAVDVSGLATGTPLYAETYQGTITGGTITTGATASVTTNAGVLAFVVPSGGSGGSGDTFATNIAWLWFTNATGMGYGQDAGGTNVQISVIGTNTWYIRLPL